MKSYLQKLPEFKIRCSQIGLIMTDSRDKKGIGKTVYSYLHQWIINNATGKHKEFTSAAMQKGTVMETEAIEYLSEVNNMGFLLKNETFYENDFCKGTPDLVLKDEILDIKCPEDVHTMPYFDDKIESIYEWQLIGYMGLTGKSKSRVIKVLMDAPDFYVENKARNKAYEIVNTTGAEFDDIYFDVYQETKERYTFSNLPKELRIKEIEVLFCKDKWQAINDRVMFCREVIKKIVNN